MIGYYLPDHCFFIQCGCRDRKDLPAADGAAYALGWRQKQAFQEIRYETGEGLHCSVLSATVNDMERLRLEFIPIPDEPIDLSGQGHLSGKTQDLGMMPGNWLVTFM